MRPSAILVSILGLASIVAISGCSTSTETANGGSGGGGTNTRTGALVVPATVDFGPMTVGQSHDTVVPFMNTGADSLTITSNGLSSADAHDTNFFVPFVIGAYGYHSFPIQFTAMAAGARTASDTIHYKVGGTPAVAIMTLTANATSGGGTTGNGGLVSIPSAVDFGPTPVGQSRDTLIAVYNPSGGGPVTILMNQTSSADLVDSNFQGSITLAAGRGIVIHVQFKPSQAGARSATDLITYTSGGSVQTLSIPFMARGVAGGGGGGGGSTPGAGSTYTYDTWQVDTNGNTSAHSDSTYTIVSNSMAFSGKTNVMEMRGPDGSLTYYHVETNGDVSIYLDLSQLGLPIPVTASWYTIPLGSHREITQLIDSAQGFILSSDAKYLASPSVTAANQTFATQQGSLSFNASYQLGPITLPLGSLTTMIWYAPSIKFYAKRQDVQSSVSGLGGTAKNSSTNYLLKGYTAK